MVWVTSKLSSQTNGLIKVFAALSERSGRLWRYSPSRDGRPMNALVARKFIGQTSQHDMQIRILHLLGQKSYIIKHFAGWAKCADEG